MTKLEWGGGGIRLGTQGRTVVLTCRLPGRGDSRPPGR
jgi:hypothetical protein